MTSISDFLQVKRISLLISALLLVLCIAGCASAAGKYEIKYAEKFSVDYRENNIKLVTDSAGKQFLLVPSGEKVPDYYKDMAHTMLVRTPVNRVFLCSTSQVSFLKLLDRSKKLYDSVVAVTTEEADWTDEKIRSLMKSGKIRYLPEGRGQKSNVERIIEIKPDLVLPSGMDLGETKIMVQLKEAGIPALSVGDYTEASDEAYLEWVKFYGAFYNMDEEADSAFREMLARKRSLTEKIVKSISEEKLKKPVVALGLLFNGLVYTQSGEGKFTTFINSTGGIHALAGSKINGSVQISMEEFFNRCKDADILIYSSTKKYTPSKKALLALNPLFAEFKAMKKDNIYIYDSGYYVNSAEIIEKFEDMAYILHPSLLPGHRLRHYEKLPD